MGSATQRRMCGLYLQRLCFDIAHIVSSRLGIQLFHMTVRNDFWTAYLIHTWVPFFSFILPRILKRKDLCVLPLLELRGDFLSTPVILLTVF